MSPGLRFSVMNENMRIFSPPQPNSLAVLYF